MSNDVAPDSPTDDDAVAALVALVRIPTVSVAGEPSTGAPFTEFLAEHARRFPLMHARLQLTLLEGTAMLFHWRGASSERPVVLMAHLDVVGVETADPWRHPAFSAEIADGEIWGRGTLDDKGSLTALCLAVERLLARGVTPTQDIWLSFGNGEEVSGAAASAAVEHLRTAGVRPWFVLDEGGAVAARAFPGVAKPLAVIGVAEKGTTTVELTVAGRGGHSSTPARGDAVARLARAIVRLDNYTFPGSLPAPTIEMLTRLAPHAAPAMRPVLSRTGRFGGAITKALQVAGPESAAMTRTTAVVTTLSGSPGHNVLASVARAGVNLRIMVGDTVTGTVERIRRVIGDDRVQITVGDANEPSPVSPWDDDAFRLIEAVIADSHPDAVPTPYVMMGGTDARYFTTICPRVYRFAPFRMGKEQRASVHAYDERIGVRDFLDGIGFYTRLIERVA
ncbi:M20/M25/M40 family metallo-hydrolase [Occultella kanbiaonis]|uniref:M20/M25/M40 family metallo-hydrolase n=1 Tax=Occultella kanbiaonis TaxID=2675754 RepID=UPI0013D6E643|nr:M20/M25/M40 family metallo-hydrolase [Occultella kanbiaonis]